MGSEKFCLRWNDFESNISVAFREIREEKDFFDCTLSCGARQIQAHKLILSACSPFFRSILKQNPHQHPLLYMKGVEFTNLIYVLNFMYHGEVNVAQEELNSFLAIAEDLKVKGLTQSKSENPKQNLAAPKARPRDPPKRLEPNQEHKLARTVVAPQPPPSYPAEYDDIQEVIPVKSEPVSLPSESVQHHPVEVDTHTDNSMAMYDDSSYADYDNYQEVTEHNYGGAINATANADEHAGPAINNPSPQDRANMFLVHMAMVMEGAVKKWQCVLCGKMSKLKADILDHVEAKHMDNSFLYHCRYCSKVLNTNGNLRTHEVNSCNFIQSRGSFSIEFLFINI
eukprot:TRINITY_DN6619_c0_g1_i5.p1 TRINITY_DN6619_c0_g1~~TRINITY_DN6619_c0_g1_i5.p1  ORF type:complete len:340 (-),score=102.31 TRINITY_DN6619_c0_g1_i5:350-1369(-)